jgi:two-component system chemotaxis sensor kinase CheA
MHSALPLFVSECSERLDRLETALLALERDGCEREALDAMFRDAHTIKGNASVVQSGDIEWFAHIVESVLERLRSGNLQADRQLISTLLPCVDHLRFLVSLATQPQAAASVLADEERTRLIGLLVPYLGDDIPQAHGIAAGLLGLIQVPLRQFLENLGQLCAIGLSARIGPCLFLATPAEHRTPD